MLLLYNHVHCFCFIKFSFQKFREAFIKRIEEAVQIGDSSSDVDEASECSQASFQGSPTKVSSHKEPLCIEVTHTESDGVKKSAITGLDSPKNEVRIRRLSNGLIEVDGSEQSLMMLIEDKNGDRQIKELVGRIESLTLENRALKKRNCFS